MDKKMVGMSIGIALIIIAGLAVAQVPPQIFTTPVEIWNSDSRGFVVVENFLSPKDHFRIDSTPGGHIYTTTLEPIGSPNPSLGTPTNPYSGGVYGQTTTLVADYNTTCTDQCNNMDGKPVSSYNWTCTSALLKNGTSQTCTDIGRERNCICKNG